MNKEKEGYDLDKLNLDVRTHNILQLNEITTIGELMGTTELELLRKRQIGRKRFLIIMRALNEWRKA